MKIKKWKKFGIIVSIPAVLCFIVSLLFGTKINNYLSTFSILKSEGESYVEYFSVDNNQTYLLQPGEKLTLPVRFQQQLFRFGVYLGEQYNTDDEYTFQLEDENGNILSKAVEALKDISPNSFIYLNASRSVISTKNQYYLKIFSDASSTIQKPLKLIVSNANSFNTSSFSINDNETDKTAILDFRYQAVDSKYLVIVNSVLIAIAVIYWTMCFVKYVLPKAYLDKAREIIKKLPYKKALAVIIIILFVADIVVLLIPQKVQAAILSNEQLTIYTDRAVPLNDGVEIEQYFEYDGKYIADDFGIMFGTYGKTIKNGTVSFELTDLKLNTVIYSETVNTEKFIDNSYYYFNIGDALKSKAGSYSIKLSQKSFSENQVLAVYLNNNFSKSMYAKQNDVQLNESVIFNLCQAKKIPRIKTIFVLSLILLILISIYIVCFIKFKKSVLKYAIYTVLGTVILFPFVMSIVSYGELSLNAAVSLFYTDKNLAVNREYDQEELHHALTTIKEYDYNGELFELYENTELPTSCIISNISLEFDNSEMLKKDYDINVYWDTGNGFNESQHYTCKYIHYGENKVSFKIPCREFTKKMMISVGFLSSKLYTTPEKLIPLISVKINTDNLQSDDDAIVKSIVVLLCLIAFFTIIFSFKKIKDVFKLFSFLKNKRISLSAVFIVIAAIYGSAMSLMMPTFHTPDEWAHFDMFFSDFGDPTLQTRILSALEDQGSSEIKFMPGQAIDLEKYNQAAKNYLDDYTDYISSLSIKLIRRPGQALGVLIALILHLPAYWILQFGEFGALAVYIALGALTLKLMPYKKNLMMAIMLLPAAIHQAGTFSYDSFVNATSFLTIAYILYLRETAPKVGWKQMLKLFLLAIVLLLGKVVYVLLIGLIFIIPINKWELKFGKKVIDSNFLIKHKKLLILISIPLIIVVGLAAFSLLVVLGYGSLLKPVIEMLSNFTQLIRLIFTTIFVHHKLWFQGATCILGNWDVPVNYLFIQFLVISLFVFAFMHHRLKANNSLENSEIQVKRFSAWNYIIWFLVFFGIFTAVLMSMVSWGFFIYGIDSTQPYSVSMRLLPWIEGVQGRYFIPILPLIFIPLHTKKNFLKFIPQGIFKICYYSAIIIYPTTLLLARYWGIGSI